LLTRQFHRKFGENKKMFYGRFAIHIKLVLKVYRNLAKT
jgi:hypothetical protein